MYSCHNTAVFIVVARAACGLYVPTSRRPQDGRKWSAGKFKDISAHQREKAQNGGCSPESVLNYLEIWLRHPPPIYMAFSRRLGVKKNIDTYVYFQRGSVPTRCTLGSAVFREFFLRNGSN
jgi:hypothetical protein